jgi:uncharacterized metal-binding protein
LTCVKAGISGLGHSDIVNEEKSPGKPVVYACSGCSDAGEIADRVARQLTCDGAAQMSCLAGIGGRVKSLLLKAERADRILVVDGCPLNCAAHTLKLAGFKDFDHLELHRIGIRKGSCPVNAERIETGVAAAKKILSAPAAAKPLLPPMEKPEPILSSPKQETVNHTQ